MEPMDNFDPEINRTHTLECLKRLMILYSQDDVCHCRRGKFVAVYVLYNIDSDDALFTSLQLKDTFMYEMHGCHASILPLFYVKIAKKRKNGVSVLPLLFDYEI